MSVDISKAVKRKEEEARKTAERNAKNAARFMLRWKPRVGENKIRILPPWSNDENNPNSNSFEREVHQHWGAMGEGGPPITCPLKTPQGIGAPPVTEGCPICKEVDRLRATKDPADQELAKDLRAKGTHMSNVVDLKDPVYKQSDLDTWEEENTGVEPVFSLGDTKIQVWSFGATLYKELLDIFADGIDITNLEAGHNLILTREGKGRESTKYRLRMDPAKTSFVPQQIELTEKLYDLDALVQYKTVSDINAMLERSDESIFGQLGGNSDSNTKQLKSKDSEADEAEGEPEPPVAAKKPVKPVKGAKSSVDDLEAQLKAALKDSE